MDVELEKVEEGVCYEGDGAVEFGLNAIVEFKRETGFVTGRKRDIL
jgi:hypothetical protein